MSKLKLSYLCTVLLILYFPIIVLIVFSLNNSTYSLDWHGFSFRWYAALWKNYEIWQAAWHSLVLGVIAASSATLLGGLTAINFYRYQFAGRSYLQMSLITALIAPDIMLAIALLVLCKTLHISFGFASLLCAHITLCLPFVAISIHNSLKTCDKNIFEAAKDLGASEFTLLTTITVPMIWPQIAAAWLLSFTLSLDDIVISYFVSGPKFDILPLKIYALARLGVKPELNALCSIMFCLTILLVLGAHWLQQRHQTGKIPYAT